MKKAIFLALIFATFIFFTGCDLDSTDTHTVAVLAEMAARNVGLEKGYLQGVMLGKNVE